MERLISMWCLNKRGRPGRDKEIGVWSCSVRALHGTESISWPGRGLTRGVDLRSGTRDQGRTWGRQGFILLLSLDVVGKGITTLPEENREDGCQRPESWSPTPFLKRKIADVGDTLRYRTISGWNGQISAVFQRRRWKGQSPRLTFLLSPSPPRPPPLYPPCSSRAAARSTVLHFFFFSQWNWKS